jgi:hydroxyacylglutathione hydrolase
MRFRRKRSGVVTVLLALLAVVLAAAWGAPYLYAEYALPRHAELVGPQPRQPFRGRWFDDYFIVEEIDPATFAIGEPRYYQGNYSYLLLGSERAVLVDAGSGNRDIEPVVRSLTTLPVTVVPSHLHFDHVGALGRLDRTALLDVGGLRDRVRDGMLELGRYEFLGFADGLRPPRFRVDEWWQPATTLDLGGRRLAVIHTPGHTPTSMSLYDAQRRQLFCGDFVYPGLLYAFLPGASRHDYRRTTARLLAMLDPGAELLTAHLPDEPALIAAPRLGMADLRALQTALAVIDAGSGTPTGFYPRVYPVNATLKFATGFAWSVR